MNWSRVVRLSLAATLILLLPFLFDYYLVLKGLFHLQLLKIFNPYTLAIVVQLLPISFFILAAFVWQKSRITKINGFADKVDSFSQVLLHRFFPLSLITVSIVWIAGWLPHYITWPWWMDIEHFALSALMWDNGKKPYRDLFDFNFPGPIYFFWVVGKVIGWGRPLPINLIDSLLVVSCGPLLVFWSRRKLNSVVPGLLGFVLILRYYMSLDYSKVMQRDWHVVYLFILSMIVLQLSNHPRKWVFTGAIFASAFIIRPYAILFVPSILTILYDENGLSNKSFRCLFLFAISSLFFIILAILPLLTSGIFGDFINSILNELKYGKYTPTNRRSILTHLYLQANTKVIFSAITGMAIAFISIAIQKCKNERSFILPWIVSYFVFLFYKPLCPVRHAYTEIPMEFIACICCGIAYHHISKLQFIRPSSLMVFLVIWFTFYFPGMPAYFDLKASKHALIYLANNQIALQAPPGCRTLLGNCDNPNFSYCWQDYTQVLRFIRKELKPDVKVANFLRSRPYPTINSLTGRQTIWPCGEGLLWLQSVDSTLEPQFIKALESKAPTVIIWCDQGEKFKPLNNFQEIETQIRINYEPLEKFGNIAVWKQKGLGRNEFILSQTRPEYEFANFKSLHFFSLW